MIRRPPGLPVRPTVGIVSPASPADPVRLQSGIAVLISRGFDVRVAPHALDRDGHMAGTDQARAADFAAFYADPAIDLVWCARGGSSSCRLWPRLPWDTFAALPPKLVIGYSDITSLHVPLVQRARTIALHGPMVCELADTPAAVIDWLLSLLRPFAEQALVPGVASRTLTPGIAEGPLCGGCLSLLCATLGTPYQLDTRGKLLLLEDIDESPIKSSAIWSNCARPVCWTWRQALSSARRPMPTTPIRCPSIKSGRSFCHSAASPLC